MNERKKEPKKRRWKKGKEMKEGSDSCLCFVSQEKSTSRGQTTAKPLSTKNKFWIKTQKICWRGETLLFIIPDCCLIAHAQIRRLKLV